jgi:DNA-binding MarR family transcriptional regulator
VGRPPRPRRPPEDIAEHGTLPVVSSALAIDRVVHERMRLAIIAALTLNDALGFPDLKELLGATDGNLIVHARRLEDAGYISCTKITDGRAPRTIYRLTPAGRAALRRYLDRMESLATALRAPRAADGDSAGDAGSHDTRPSPRLDQSG